MTTILFFDARDGDQDDAEVEVVLTPRQIAVKAVLQLLLGTAICALFSDPMVGAVSSFSKVAACVCRWHRRQTKLFFVYSNIHTSMCIHIHVIYVIMLTFDQFQASGIPAFFVGFVVTPFASNSSELVSSLRFAAKKRTKNISLTFSQVYGAVTMNNTLVLGVFLLVVWYQDLSWTYTSEVAIIVGTTLLVGGLGMTRLTWRAWSAFALLALYPLSVVLVYIFDFILKWDG